MVTITLNQPPVTKVMIEIKKLEQMRTLFAQTKNSVWGVLSLMDTEGAFTGLEPSEMIEVFRIAEMIKKDPTYMQQATTED